MNKYFQNLKKTTKSSTKVFIGVIFISIIGIIFSNAFVDKIIGSQIEKNIKSEITNLGDKFYFSIRSHYKIFFYEYGDNEKLFEQTNEAAKKETINDLKEIFSKERYQTYLITPKGTIQLNGQKNEKDISLIKQLPNNFYRDAFVDIYDENIVYKREFLPWNWSLILIQDNSSYKDIIFKNNLLIIFSIGGLVVFILLFLNYLLNSLINKPIEKIINFLQKVTKGRYSKIELQDSLEFTYVADSINIMVEEVQKREKELNFEQNKTRSILDTQHDIVILNDGKEMVDVNLSFFKFFEQFDNLESFKKEHDCICEFFIKKEGYIQSVMDGVLWVEYLLNHPKNKNQAIIIKDSKKYIFNLYANKVIIDNEPLYIITLNDVTQIEMHKIELEKQIKKAIEKNSEQEHVLHQQAKDAQMGQMLSMIAHQWRQPLNAISASSINLSLLNDLDAIDSNQIKKHVDFIQNQTQKMSKTIDDFMNFFKPEKNKTNFTFDMIEEQILSLMEAQLKSRGIEISFVVKGENEINSYEKELEHILINIIANARDAYEGKDREIKKIVVEFDNSDAKYLHISVTDNAGGIEPKYLDAIFNPYFTTKEQGKGTGIGLYMTRRIIQEVFDGDINASNTQDGAIFTMRISK